MPRDDSTCEQAEIASADAEMPPDPQGGGTQAIDPPEAELNAVQEISRKVPLPDAPDTPDTDAPQGEALSVEAGELTQVQELASATALPGDGGMLQEAGGMPSLDGVGPAANEQVAAMTETLSEMRGRLDEVHAATMHISHVMQRPGFGGGLT